MPLLASQHWLQRYAITLVGLALITAMSVSLAWQSADWLRLLRAPVTVSNNSANPSAVPAQRPEISQLFGTNVANNDLAPSTTLRLTLLGSFVHADPKRSSAIIRSEGSPAQRYSVDDEISNGVRLHSVAADRVELIRNGRRESLAFALNSSPAGTPKNSAPQAAVDPVEQLSEMQSDDLSQLRERMDALRQQMQDSTLLPGSATSTEQTTENN